MKAIASAVWKEINGRTAIQIFDKNFRSEIIFPNINPYCFVREKDINKIENKLQNAKIEQGDYINFDREKCIKTKVDLPNQIYDKTNPNCVRTVAAIANIPTYEADIRFVQRWMIDENIYPDLEPRILFIDTESDCREGLHKPRRLLSIACVNDLGEKIFICNDSEEEMLTEFFKILQNYPVVVGFNVENWDILRLKERMNACNIHYPLRNHQWLDLRELYKKSEWGLYSSGKLDDICTRELGVGKTFNIEQIGGVKALYDLFKNNREKLKEYNLNDAMLLKMLDDKLALLKTKIEQAVFAGVLYSDTIYVSRIIDTLMLRKLFSEHPRYVANNRKIIAKEKKAPKFRGALVLEPKRGIYENLFSFDFASLYPSIIKIWNVGIDTLDLNGKLKTEVASFKAWPNAKVTELLKDLSKLRTKYKNLRDQYKQSDLNWIKYQVQQIGIKTILLGSWGAFGEEGGRWYKKEIAESITSTARSVLLHTIEIANNLGLEVIYGDTDSIFFKCPEEFSKLSKDKLIEKGKALERTFNIILKQKIMKKYNIPEWRYSSKDEPYGLKLEFSNLFIKAFFSSQKKKYIAKTYFKGKTSVREVLTSSGFADENTIIVGFEMKKYDTFKLLKILQEKIFKIIFEEKSLNVAIEKSKELLRKSIFLMYSGLLDKELIQKKGVRKDLNSYPVSQPHVRVAEELKNAGLFRSGDVVDFVIVSNEKNLKASPVIEGAPFPKILPSGYKYYEQRICEAVSRLFEEKIQISYEDIRKFIYNE
jgi:DNA polymerase elongation subunit (family B)